VRAAHRIIVLRDGRCVESGTFDELASNPASEFVQIYQSALQ